MMQASAIRNDLDSRLPKLVSACAKRFPEATAEIARTGKPRLVNQNGLLRSQVQVSFDTDEGHFAINYSIARLVAALFYNETKVVLPVGRRIRVGWYSNAQPMTKDNLEKLLDKLPRYETLKMGKLDKSDQFEARFQVNVIPAIGAFAFYFNRSFVGVGFTFEDELDGLKNEDDDFFVISEDGLMHRSGEFPKHLRIKRRGKLRKK